MIGLLMVKWVCSNQAFLDVILCLYSLNPCVSTSTCVCLALTAHTLMWDSRPIQDCTVQSTPRDVSRVAQTGESGKNWRMKLLGGTKIGYRNDLVPTLLLSPLILLSMDLLHPEFVIGKEHHNFGAPLPASWSFLCGRGLAARSVSTLAEIATRGITNWDKSHKKLVPMPSTSRHCFC